MRRAGGPVDQTFRVVDYFLVVSAAPRKWPEARNKKERGAELTTIATIQVCGSSLDFKQKTGGGVSFENCHDVL